MSFDQTTSEHVSEAVEPPLLSNQALSSSKFPFPSHSTVSFVPEEIKGGVVSSIVNVADASTSLPHSSTNVNSTVAEPVAPQSSDKPEKLFDHAASPHASYPDPPPLESNQALSSSKFPLPSHSTVSP